jgi:hypothetical protein
MDHLKLMVLGEHAVGKTRLTAALLGQPPAPAAPTIGVDFASADVGGVTVQVWDGGSSPTSVHLCDQILRGNGRIVPVLVLDSRDARSVVFAEATAARHLRDGIASDDRRYLVVDVAADPVRGAADPVLRQIGSPNLVRARRGTEPQQLRAAVGMLARQTPVQPRQRRWYDRLLGWVERGLWSGPLHSAVPLGGAERAADQRDDENQQEKPNTNDNGQDVEGGIVLGGVGDHGGGGAGRLDGVGGVGLGLAP